MSKQHYEIANNDNNGSISASNFSLAFKISAPPFKMKLFIQFNNGLVFISILLDLRMTHDLVSHDAHQLRHQTIERPRAPSCRGRCDVTCSLVGSSPENHTH